ncbi:MAG: hypothetical protein V4603_08885 [Pseudomonadota bacterium]
MIDRSRLMLAALATALLSGCASQAVLQIRSEPQGAYITDDNGELLGIAPVDIAYDVDNKTRECVDTGGFSARWVSGAETFIEPVVLCNPGYASTLIKRDMSKPGLQEDLEFAVEAELLELERQETRAAQSSAQADWAAAAAMQDAAWGWRYGYGGPFGYSPFYRGSYFGFGMGFPYYNRPYYRDYDGRDGYRDDRNSDSDSEYGTVVPAPESSAPAEEPQAAEQ